MISEVAELSVESHKIAKEIGVEKKMNTYEPPQEIRASPTMSSVQWSTVKFQEGHGEDEPTETESQMTDLDGDASESAYYDSNSSRIPLKELLDRWQEPVSKKDKVSPSIQSICIETSVSYFISPH